MSNNPFETHNIKHLSPSSINRFRQNPAKWLTNIAGYKDQLYIPAFTNGNAIEVGITHAITTGASIAESTDKAMEEYESIRNNAKDAGVEYDLDGCAKKQRRAPDILANVIPVFRSFGAPIATQKWVEWQWSELPIPIRGIIDFEYEDCVRDLKTASVKPKDNDNYNRQMTVYALATDKIPYLDYVYSTSKIAEVQTFEIPDIITHIADIKRIATKMMRLLSLSDDIEEVCYLSCLDPDLSNQNWYDQWGRKEIEGAKKLFNK
jgi:hypothetical protein